MQVLLGIFLYFMVYPDVSHQMDSGYYKYEEEQTSTTTTPGVPLEHTSLRGPYFDTTASKNVTALVGKTAYLNCRVRNVGNRTISWVRHRDIHLLTVSGYTYTSDQRFSCLHKPQNEDWTLQIKYPQKRDSGIYECQVSTTPPIGISMYLSVVEPITQVIGGPDMYINKGSTMNLTCIIKHSPEPPPAIYWLHNTEEINYDSPRGGVSVITEKGDVTTSYLSKHPPSQE
uniref:Neuronal growth regulator 1 n=2 Tax=Cacopsylla melanoneura TaxID=428564 RepID=A0A8D9F664_9HEMI